jgi:predicted ArsR family transcriptional regulator
MSMALFVEVKQLKAQCEALRLSLRAALDRIEALEALPEVSTLQEEPKRRGRPPKPVTQ